MGTNKTFRIPVSTGLFEHYPRIEESIWFFLWAIDKTTQEIPDPDEPGKKLGVVLGGKPQTDEEIAKSFPGASVRTIRRYRTKLVHQKYLKQRRTPCGHSLWVRNSQKWFSDKGPSTDGQSQGSAINGRSLPGAAKNGHSLQQKGSAINGEGSAKFGDAYRQDSHSKVTRQKERKRELEEKPQPSRLLSFDDMNLKETVGERFHFEHTGTEETVRLISDGEFNSVTLDRYEYVEELGQACREAVRQMNQKRFKDRTTCAEIMDRAMKILDGEKIKAPSGWLPVIKTLRKEGGPATASKSKTQQIQERGLNIFGPNSAFNWYAADLKPFEQILVETAVPLPGCWSEAVQFLNTVITEHPNTDLRKLIAVRDQIQERIPSAK